MSRGGGQPTADSPSETDYWYITSPIQEAYDHIVKESDGWRERARFRKKGRFSFLSRKKSEPFVVDQADPPRLYRLRDNEIGELSFELSEVEDGGTSIKSTYGSRGRALVQNLRSKMPVKVPAYALRKCPTCGKEMLPDFKACPFCGTKL